MGRVLIKVIWWVAGFAISSFALVWLILATPLFTDLRRSVVESVLSEQIGQAIYVKEDVSVILGPVSRVYVGDVEIPSEDISDTVLARLEVLEFDIDLAALWDGQVDLDNLIVQGLQVNMLTREDGTTSWTKREDTRTPGQASDARVAPSAAVPSGAAQESGGIFAFLKDKTVSFTSIGLKIDNQPSGFSFVFDLQNLNLDQLDEGQRVSVTSKGTVNGQTFTIKGDYPKAAPFTTRSSFGEMKLSFDGNPIPASEGGGFWGTLSLNTGEFGDFLEVLGLSRTLEGQGVLSTKLTSQAGVLNVQNLDTVIQLRGGQEFTTQGSVENLLAADGFDIKFSGRLHPEGQPPERAKELKDFKLTEITAHLINGAKSLEFKELHFTTNSFDQELEKVGPISIGRIRRTEDGKLAIEDVSVQAGPDDAPYIVANGNIRNLLELKSLDFEGALAAPASLILKELGDDVAEAFGAVNAEFAIDDASGALSLKRLNAYTVDTDIWALKARAALESIGDLNELDFDFDLDIANGASFLGALQLEEVDVGPLEIVATGTGAGNTFSTTFGLMAGTSRLDSAFDTSVAAGSPVLKGRIFSERLDISDLKNAAASIVQLRKLGKNKTEDSDEPALDAPEVQPLVLPKTPGKPGDMLNLQQALLEADIFVAIDVKQIVGQDGVASLSSELAAKDGQAHLGPLDVSYGGGFFKLGATMDLVKSPDLLTVSGATGGWDFGNILDAVGLGIQAHGKLRGDFKVTGNRTSARTFVDSASGSASIFMSQGNISTSMIELAGLGIFPWLFSKELSQGYSDIVCLAAPVRIEAGKVSSDSLVVETESVQLVAKGAVDWKNDSISLRAVPRRVGKPLSRSAWPINVTGKLSAPDFKLEVGGSFRRRTDGATDMPADRKPCVPDIRQLQ